MKKKENFWKILFLLFICFSIIKPYSVQAANPVQAELRAGRLYKGYDITGDKKKDKVRINLIKNGSADYYTYSGIKVYVNGKTAYQLKNKRFYGFTAEIYTLKNGKPFLYLSCWEDNGDGPVCALFQYRSGKFRKVADFRNMFSKYGTHTDGKIVKVSGNTIKAEFYVMSYTLGPSHYRYQYVYKNGTLKRKSTIGTIDRVFDRKGETKIFTAGKTLRAYTSVSAKKTAFRLRKGKKITVDKVYCGSRGMWIRGKYNGKYGWIKCADHFPVNEPQTFSNVGYAG